MDTSQFKFYVHKARHTFTNVLIAAPDTDAADRMRADWLTGYLIGSAKQVAAGTMVQINHDAGEPLVLVCFENAKVYDPEVAYTQTRSQALEFAKKFVNDNALDGELSLTIVWANGEIGCLLYRQGGELRNLQGVYFDRERVEYLLLPYYRAARLQRVELTVDWTKPTKAEQAVLDDSHNQSWYRTFLMNQGKAWRDAHSFAPWVQGDPK